MICRQMVCIVSKNFERSAPLSSRERRALNALFKRIGRIHFAALALLPPLPERMGPPSLLLELAVDDGLSHAELVELLAERGQRALWPLYGRLCKGSDLISDRSRRDWLRGHLLKHLQGAHGGFVGARDRSVSQIRAEHRLYVSARHWIRTNPPAPGEDREALARRLAGWAAQQPEFSWAIEPPRRSFWRAQWMTTPWRVFLALAFLVVPLIAVALVVLAIIAFAGVLAIAAFVFVPGVEWNELVHSPAIFGEYAEWAPKAVRTVRWVTLTSLLITYVGVSAVRSLTLTALLLLGFGVLLMVGILWYWYEPAGGALLGIAGAVEVLVRTGVVAIFGVISAWVLVGLAFVAALLALPPFLGLRAVVAAGIVLIAAEIWTIHWLLDWLVADRASIGYGLFPVLHQQTVLGLPAIDAIALTVFAAFSAIAVGLSFVIKLPPFTTHRVANRMDRTTTPKEPLFAGHQVHESIEACESELARGGRISHMFSLTEIRDPVERNRWLLRFFLFLVSYLGHTVFVNGKLGTAEGVRFGHWHVIDAGRRFLFCSNYDGAFGGYLDEFITGAAEGTNLFWRWTELRARLAAATGHPEVACDREFPPTSLLVFSGCKHEQWFKTYARDSMLPHIYRWEAYKYTAQDVERATRLREALFGPRNAVRDDQVMRALES